MYTEGDWLTYADYSGAVESIVVRWKNHTVKSVCDINLELKESEANAHLIAAAPDMYEAIRWVLEDYREKRANTSLAVSTHTRLLNALAKAEGK